MRTLLFTMTASVTLATQLAMAAPTFSVRTRMERPPEMQPITIADIGYNGESFSFVLPQNWRFDPDTASSALRFHSEDGGKAKISIQFSAETPPGVFQSADALRQFAAPNLSSAQLLEEFPIYSNNGQGKGALFGYGFEMRCRAAVVPLGHGCATFVLTCRTNEMVSEQTLSALITSFRKVAVPAAK